MSGIQVELQPAHGYVPLLMVVLLFVNLWAGIKVGKARKLYGVDYPQVRLKRMLSKRRHRTVLS